MAVLPINHKARGKEEKNRYLLEIIGWICLCDNGLKSSALFVQKGRSSGDQISPRKYITVLLFVFNFFRPKYQLMLEEILKHIYNPKVN